jgi:hypothetical protein
LIIGDFQNNKRTGHGKLSFYSGDVYEGSFIDGLMDGNGVYSFKESGEILRGSFSGGKFVESKNHLLQIQDNPINDINNNSSSDGENNNSPNSRNNQKCILF